MYLSRLEIQGFKSFANKVTLDFQPGITAIVGPNGSGKSNVADSIRWVLGEQSLKMLRGKKSEDVIFAGSDKKSRLGVAEVSLYLNNEDRSAAIEYSELVITRRVFRDGQGEYLINHQQARLQDIQLMLAQANFGQRTYSVIGQGMIDSFLISSPQERKHLFDEAAGVRQFQMKKDQALQKLAQAKENLAQGETVMAEIEPRLRSLTRQVKRLERRGEIEQDLRNKQTSYFALLWKQLDGELSTLNDQHQRMNKQRAEVEKELTTIQQELESIEQERSASEVFAGLQKSYNEILESKNRLLERQALIKGKLELSAQEAGATETVFWQKRADQVKHQLDQLNEEAQTAKENVERLRHKVTERRKVHDTIEKHFVALEEKIAKIEASWKETSSIPEAQAAISAFFDKYHQFVEHLHGSDELDVSAIRKTATNLRQELEKIVKKFQTAAAQDPAETSHLQQELLTAAKERQTTLHAALELEGQVRLEEQRLGQLQAQQEKLQAEFDQLQQDVSTQELAKTSPEQAYGRYVDEAKKIEKEIIDIDARLKESRAAINDFNAGETSKKDRLFTLQKHFRDTQHQLNVATNQANDIQVNLARLEQRREDQKREIAQAMGDEAIDRIIVAATQPQDGDALILAEEVGGLLKQLSLIGGIDEQTTQEYQETNERWEFLNTQAEDLHAAIEQLEKGVAELEATIKKRFDAAFKKINEEFGQYFRTLFRGGKAELSLFQEVIKPAAVDEDEDDEDEDDEDDVVAAAPVKGEKVVTGIEIKATPPGKKLQSIAMLSGGERALTSIALLCAIISNNPSPFVTLDEVDAALDEANSQRFAAILDHLAKKSQFIAITHNRATMEKAGVLYGVTMGEDGVSQLLSVKMDEAEKIIQQHGNR